MTTKINRLEIENVKRVKAAVIEPNQNGLTIIGGNNNQGKTSVLDAIATRVSVGDECEIIIEDGYAVKNETLNKPTTPPANDWSAKGAF